MKFVQQTKTNLQKIFLPLLVKPPFISTHVIPRAKKVLSKRFKF